ncbi:LysR family transcriptional regulator [uncultured Defluviicoccus sp.]|uniref:LysR family transcriptional regulator n=1 Tax=metagenome TaxID=256318 RepID=A0A380TIU4_9ZZZZ|nr:LysR family transcriptional regulator [uncultured Defluviicoccus sp.]
MRFDLADLRLFLHVAEARSITHGAERSNLALASASARIRGMEATLGVPLLLRDRRGVSLSPAGQNLVEHARLITQQVERMRGDLSSFARGLSGSVRLLSNTAALSEHLPKVLARFLASNPTISLDVEERESADIAAALGSGAADVGIASAAALPDTIEQFPFRDDVLVLVVPQADTIGRKRPLALTELIDRAFIGLPRESALQRHIARHAAQLGATLNVRARVTSFEAICRLVESGAGVGIVPEVSARRYRRSMRIEVAKLSEPWAKRRLSICVRRLSTLPVPAQRLVEHLRAAAVGSG